VSGVRVPPPASRYSAESALQSQCPRDRRQASRPQRTPTNASGARRCLPPRFRTPARPSRIDTRCREQIGPDDADRDVMANTGGALGRQEVARRGREELPHGIVLPDRRVGDVDDDVGAAHHLGEPLARDGFHARVGRATTQSRRFAHTGWTRRARSARSSRGRFATRHRPGICAVAACPSIRSRSLRPRSAGPVRRAFRSDSSRGSWEASSRSDDTTTSEDRTQAPGVTTTRMCLPTRVTR
jgi:hypothetical protein